MNNLSWTAFWDYSEQMTDQSYTHLNYMTTLTTFSWLCPYLGGGSVGNLMLALLPLHLFLWDGSRGVAGWVLPCFPFLLTCGRGARGQPLHMTTYLTSYAQCSQEFSSLTWVLIHTYRQIAGSLLEGRSSSSSSLLLTFSCVHFLQPTNFLLWHLR